MILANVLCNLKEYGLRWPRLLLWRPGKNRPTVLLEIELGLVNCLRLARSHTASSLGVFGRASGLVCMGLASSRRNGNSHAVPLSVERLTGEELEAFNHRPAPTPADAPLLSGDHVLCRLEGESTQLLDGWLSCLLLQ